MIVPLSWRDLERVTLACLLILSSIDDCTALPPAQKTIHLPGVQIQIFKAGNTQVGVRAAIKDLEDAIFKIASEYLGDDVQTNSQPIPDGTNIYKVVNDYNMAMFLGQAPHERTPISSLGLMAITYALILWARQYRDHGYLPPATISGRWTNRALPGGFQDFHGSIGIEQLPNGASAFSQPKQNATMTAARSIVSPFATSRYRRDRQSLGVVEEFDNTRRSSVKQIFNTTRDSNATQRSNASSNELPTDPWTDGGGSAYTSTFSQFRQRYVPIMDMVDLAMDCFVMSFMKYTQAGFTDPAEPIPGGPSYMCGGPAQPRIFFKPNPALPDHQYINWLEIQDLSSALYEFVALFSSNQRRWCPSVNFLMEDEDEEELEEVARGWIGLPRLAS